MTPATIEAQKIHETPPTALVPLSATPADLLRIAVSQNADLDKLTKLMDLQERWEQNQSKKNFVAALSAFKAQPPVLEKVKKVDFSSKGGTRVHYNYAPLDHISKVLGEALSKFNLSFRWNVRQVEKQVDVTCILQHSDGHSESVTMTAGTHDDDRMNAIQRLGSTITYLERYTLLAATGMATQEQDDDARSTPTATALPSDKIAEACEWMANARNLEELQKLFSNAYKEAGQAKDRGAMAKFIAAKDARKKELQ